MSKKKNRLIIAILIILFLIIFLIGGSIFYIKNSLKLPKEFFNNNEETTSFIVEEGAWGKSTLIKLEEEGLIKNSTITYYYNKIFGYSFYAGYYEIPHYINNEEITLEGLLAYISNPKNAKEDTVTITFYEDDFINDFASKIANNTSLNYDEIIAYWNDEEVVRSYMKEYPFLTEDIFDEDIKVILEGYLFPDTYEFYVITSLDKVTRKFLDNTLRIYEKYLDDFNNSDLSIHEIFTLASICQWESGNLDDMQKIAGVFLNRLDDGEVLGSTVTACYAFDLDKDMCASNGDDFTYTQTYHVYNTYTVQGLPPGPVLCPGENALYAALHPDQKAGYYYFVGDLCYGTGTVFAKTWSEHEDNIAKYVRCE